MKKPSRKIKDRLKDRREKSGLRSPGDIYGATGRSVSRLFQNVVMTENLFMIVLAIIIGTLAGFGAVGVRALIREISTFFYPGPGSLLDNMAASAWYHRLIMPAIGGLIVGPIIYFFAPEAKGTGVPEVMHSVLVKGGNIRPRVAFFKTLVSTITIGSGGSVGREGPIVQIGASLGSLVGQFFQISTKRMKTLVGCGAAAGIAAAFNAPIAGALFAVEIILMDFAVASFSPIVISSVMATVISHAFEGDFPAIEVIGDHALQSIWEPNFYILFGILCGLGSVFFIKILYSVNSVWEDRFKFPPYLKATVGGLTVGVIALVFPQIMGVGYDSVNLVVNTESMTYMGLGKDYITGILGDHMFWSVTLLLVLIKIFATSMTLGSGGSGGIFAPSLFIGAMLGAGFGHFAHQLFPGITASAGTYALIGMGGLVAGTTRAPITAIITIFELTKETSIILPLMLTCIISTIICSKFSRESIYTLKLILRNINLKSRAEYNVMKTIHVRDLYNKHFISIPQNKDFNEVVMTMISNNLSFLAVHDMRTKKTLGIITMRDIRSLMFEKDELRYVLIAEDMVNESVRCVTLENDCGSTLRKMRQHKIEGLPVIDSEKSRRQIGVIWQDDIVDAYEKEMQKIYMPTELADKITMINMEKEVRFLEGYAIAEVAVPESFIGHTIKKLRIRNRYGVDIITIKSSLGTGQAVKAIPRAYYKFKPGDSLIIAGKENNIVRLRHLL